MIPRVVVAILLSLVIRVLWRLATRYLQGAGGTARPSRAPGPSYSVPMVRDPICGTFVVPDRAVTITSGGERRHFCSTACRDTYVETAARERATGKTA